MDTSILNNAKKVLGISIDDTSFDTDLVLQINSAFSILNQLGVGPAGGFAIEDDEAQWADFVPTASSEIFTQVINLVKMCIFLRVRLMFDPPATSFHLAALQHQLEEHEWRLSQLRESVSWTDPSPVIPQDDDVTIIEGGTP